MRLPLLAAAAVVLAGCSPEKPKTQAMGNASIGSPAQTSVTIEYNAFRAPDYVHVVDGGLTGPSVLVPSVGIHAVRVRGCKFTNTEGLKYLGPEYMKMGCQIQYGDAANWSKVKVWTPCPKADDHTWVCDPAWKP